MMKMKKLLALLLSLVLVIGLLPTMALAEGETYIISGTVNGNAVEWAESNSSTTAPHLKLTRIENNAIDSSKNQAIEIDNCTSLSNSILVSVEIDGNSIPFSSFTGTWTTINMPDTCTNIGTRVVQVKLNNGNPQIMFAKNGLVNGNLSVHFSFLSPNASPHVTVAESDTSKGTIKTSFLNNTQSGGSTWKLTATPSSPKYYLDYLDYTTGADANTRVNCTDGSTITWEVMQDGAEYTAYFAEWPEEILSATVRATPTGLGVSAGQWAYVDVDYRVTTNVLQSTEQVFKVYNGESATGTPITTFTFTGDGDTLIGEHTVSVPIAAMPADAEKLTVTLSIDGHDTMSYTTEDAIAVKSSGTLDLTHLDMPGDAPDSYNYGSYSINDGPIVFDAVAFTGEEGVSAYFGTTDGVVHMDGTGAMTQMSGTDNIPFVAVGGASESELYALALEPGRDVSGGKIYKLTNETWAAVSGSEIASIHCGNNTFGLVMSGTDIWVGTQHWNGTSWTANSITFNSFWKDDADTAYAGSANGVYQYEGGEWTKLDGTSGGPILSAVRTADGVKLLTAAGSNFNNRVRLSSSASSLALVTVGDTVTETAISLEAFKNDYGSYTTAGAFLDLDGNIYAANKSHGSNVGFLYEPQWTSTELFKYENGEWVFQKADALFSSEDLQKYGEGIYDRKARADWITWACSPAENINFVLGAYGTAYAMYNTATISFQSNGGGEVAPITQTVGTRVYPPISPTRDDFNFMGWYTLDNLMTNGPSYTWGLMPATDITLYAKWSEKSSGSSTDVYAAEREKAQASLDTALGRLDQSDYDASVWSSIRSAYQNGKANIAAAETYDDIYAALNAAVDAINDYARNVSGTMTVAVTVEKFTVDGKYIIEPTLVTVDRNELASVVVTDLLKDHWKGSYVGTPYTMTGTEVSNFYLSGAWDGTTMLSEFDHGVQSGWMYCVNGSFPGVGASAWILKNGDVMRWQYTCTGLGSDIGNDNTAFGGSGGVTVADKDALIWKIAEINEAGTQSTYGNDYTNAMTVLKTIEAPQADVNAALAALNKQDGGNASAGGTSKAKTYQITVAATENGTAAVSASTASEGDRITVTAKPAEGFELDSISVKGEKAGTVEVKDGAFTMPADDVTVTVKFKKADAKQTFSDVKPGDWFYEGVEYVAEKGWMQGPGGGVFQPNETTTRAMVAQVLWNMAGKPVVNAAIPFADVAEGAWYADSVRWAAEKGVVTGWTDENGRQVFDPDGKVTREQFAAMLYRYAKTLGKGFTGLWSFRLDFPDAGDVSPWATEAMSWMVMQGVINGMDGRLNPQGVSTRAQVATMIQRLAGLIEN